jgi:hypothetical protein
MTQFKVTTVKIVQSAKEALELVDESVFGQSVRTLDESGEKEITIEELKGRAENEGVESFNGPTDQEVATEKPAEVAPEAPGPVSDEEGSAPAEGTATTDTTEEV